LLGCETVAAVKRRDYDDGRTSCRGNSAEFHYEYREADEIFREFFGGKDPFEAFFGNKDPFQEFFGNKDPFEAFFANSG